MFTSDIKRSLFVAVELVKHMLFISFVEKVAFRVIFQLFFDFLNFLLPAHGNILKKAVLDSYFIDRHLSEVEVSGRRFQGSLLTPWRIVYS